MTLRKKNSSLKLNESLRVVKREEKIGGKFSILVIFFSFAFGEEKVKY